jgi:ABC-type enterochelin transport system permease subunit
MVVNSRLSRRVAFVATLIAALVYVFTVPGSWLVGTRVTLLTVGIAAILSYMSEHRSRPFATLLAILVGGSSLAMVFQGITNYVTLSASAEPWLVVYVFAQTCILVCNGGNTARFLPGFLTHRSI